MIHIFSLALQNIVEFLFERDEEEKGIDQSLFVETLYTKFPQFFNFLEPNQNNFHLKYKSSMVYATRRFEKNENTIYLKVILFFFFFFLFFFLIFLKQAKRRRKE